MLPVAAFAPLCSAYERALPCAPLVAAGGGRVRGLIYITSEYGDQTRLARLGGGRSGRRARWLLATLVSDEVWEE